MSEDERLARVESDVAHLQATVEDERKESREFRKSMEHFRQKVDDFRVEAAKEFARTNQALQDFKVETAGNFGRLREDMVRGFGDLRTEIRVGDARTRLWMVVTGASAVLLILGTAVALARYLKP
ncbi:MAG TPA: hypothetical protein VGM84_18310 [Steroidobacteraceae bacterium]